ncbi:MAG: RNaseH domain-containing protein [Janthinobacterium lividum]
MFCRLRTNTARAALLLTLKKKEPESTGLLPMPEAVQLLTQNGSSFLRHGGRADYELSLQRKQLTQRFIYDLIDDVAAEHAQSGVVVLFDQRTLMSSWDWLSDQRLNPADVNFGQLLPRPEPRAQLNWPNVTFLRLRSDHAPKAMRSADRTILKTLDGKGERLAT